MPYKDPQRYREWYKKNKARADAYNKAWVRAERLRLIDQFGGQCVHCGFDNPVALDFDHKDNGGGSDRKRSRKNTIFLVKEAPEKFQLLCRNCNWIKEVNRRAVKVTSPAPTNGGSGP